MAYSGTVTVTVGVDARGRTLYEVSIAELEGAAASEATIEGVPTFGRVIRQVLAQSAGSASTFDPILGTATNPSGANVVVENDTAAASPIDNSTQTGTYYSSTGTLYHRSVPDSGTDNTVTVKYHIIEGWD